MQTVTFFSSARPTTRLRPVAQFFSPSSSDMPPRLPEKQMTLGNAVGGGELDVLAERLFEAVVVFLAVEAVGESGRRR